jgi:hypothetical protein
LGYKDVAVRLILGYLGIDSDTLCSVVNQHVAVLLHKRRALRDALQTTNDTWNSNNHE